MSPAESVAHFLPHARLDALLAALRARGYTLIGPTVHDGAIVYRPIAAADELPAGWHDVQAPGRYTLRRDDSPRRFAWANGPQALKPLAFAPRESLWSAQRDAHGRVCFEAAAAQAQPTAVIGVRACDLAALALQDAHFVRRQPPEAAYAARRTRLFLVAVDCSNPADTCFCASTGDGPTAHHGGYDIALAELDEGFVARAGSASGAEVMAELGLEPAAPTQLQAAAAQAQRAAAAQKRTLPSRTLRDALLARLEHPHWDDVAARCLSCANCTSVCPTCFCFREGDAASVDGDCVTHWREWDSCFSAAHGHIHGLQVRPDARTRYRQWLIHKLATWHDQFGRSGCVGCGRCMTWCPVGIDLTAEVAALLREAE